jgi:hypothetical protein
MVPLSKPLNITVSNFFFRKKADGYRDELYVQDVKDLAELPDWTFAEYYVREQEKQTLLKDFLLN